MVRSLISLLVLCAVTSPYTAQQTAATVSVRDFGAKGDGVTDDTEAIGKAASAAAISFSGQSEPGLHYQTGPVLLFPAGHYLISDEIALNCLEVRGEGRPVIQQADRGKGILKYKQAWRQKISNITFLGGRNQLDLRNVNLDTGQIIIDHCRFYSASGFGVYTDVLSTTAKITDCEFFFCDQAWYNGRSDQAIMSDCWITSSRDAGDKAVIEHRGVRLTLSNIVGVPLVGRPRQRWIDNYGEQLTVRQFRFGGEGGGFTPVYNFRGYRTTGWGSRIVVDDCYCCANSSYNANCVVYAYELPNSLTITNSEMVGCTAVIVDKKIDIGSYFKDIAPGMVHYSMQGCTGELQTGMPSGLTKPVIKMTSASKPALSTEQTRKALAAAKKKVASTKYQAVAETDSAGHTRQSDPANFVELSGWSVTGYMDATGQLNSDWLALGRLGSDFVAVFRKGQPGGWAHLTIRADVDLDRYPWLTWQQKKATAPGAFAVKAIDRETGRLATLCSETQTAEYSYYARNLKQLLGVSGKRKLEIRFYPLAQGWEYPSAEAGQYAVYDFMRVEAE